MEKKFILPGTTMLVGIAIWIAFLIIAGTNGEPSARMQVMQGLIVGGLFIFSALRCHHVGGPRVGSLVRAIVLLVLAVASYLKIGLLTAALLLIAAIVPVLLFLTSGAAPAEAE